jgi:hypothetical protein
MEYGRSFSSYKKRKLEDIMSKLIGNKFSSTVTSLTTSFTSSGTLTTTEHTTSAQYLVIGGGGSGGGGALAAGQSQWCFGGGGGGGGFRTNVPGATSGGGASAEPSLTVSASTSYPIVVGAGGAAGTTYTIGHNGHGSSFGPNIDATTSLLINSNTTDGSTTFTDSSSTGHTITAYGDIHHETDQSKIGNSSLHFDGTGDYLTIPAHDDWDFGTGPYTIECWIKTSEPGWIINQANNDTGIRFCVGSNGAGSGDQPIQMNEQVSNSDYNLNGATNVTDNEWHHIAVTRGSAGSSTKIYLDGTLDATGAANRNFDNDNVMWIGTRQGHGGRYFTGYIDELRISKTQRYTGNFDPLREDYIIAIGGGGSASTGQGDVAPYAQPHPSGYRFKGQDGGSGGGGGFYDNPGPQPAGRSGAGAPGQGYAGGTGSGGANVGDGGGGGGGAGAVGTSRPSVATGGAGQSSSISGSAVTYAGGGGGSRSCHPQVGTGASGDGGSGGGGNGGKGQDGPQPPSIPGANQATCRTNSAGTVNTGGGGGGNSGARYNGVHDSVNNRTAPGGHLAVAKAGGSGIVIVKEVVPGSITTYNGSLWKAGGIWNARDVYKERVKDNWG